MARPKKKGLDYFPVDVDIFSDRKIKVVIGRYGAEGYMLYMYLLTLIYHEGYFIRLDTDFGYLISADLHLDGEKMEEMLAFFLGRALFDEDLFRRERVLTSVSIQKRYQEAVKTRGAKRGVPVEEAYWLLRAEETEEFIEVGENPGLSREKTGSSEEESPKERKEKEKKEEETKEEEPAFYGAPAARFPTYQDIIDYYGEEVAELYLQKAKGRGYTGEKAKGKAALWIREDELSGEIEKYYPV